MRHRKRTLKLGRRSAHLQAMFANMACSLITEGRIKTTLPKAKALRSVVEKLITLGKKGSLHNRRTAISRMGQKDAVAVLFDQVAPFFAERNGGYTRIIKLGKRLGDGAPLCFIELVDYTSIGATTEEVAEETAETVES